MSNTSHCTTRCASSVTTALIFNPIQFKETSRLHARGPEVIECKNRKSCLQSPSILVPRPRRLRDEKRAMGTRMKPELDQFRTHTLYFLTTGESERNHVGMNGNLFRQKTEQEKELNDTDKI